MATKLEWEGVKPLVAGPLQKELVLRHPLVYSTVFPIGLQTEGTMLDGNKLLEGFIRFCRHGNNLKTMLLTSHCHNT